MSRPVVVIGTLGTTLDAVRGPERWDRWRPSVSICQQDDLLVRRFDLLHPPRAEELLRQVVDDIRAVSPETEVRPHAVDVKDAWDFEAVYGALHDFARGYAFAPEREEYLVHITTGSHVQQICLFLLTESRHIPGKLVQTSPRFRPHDPAGEARVIDLDLSRYDRIAARFEREHSSRVAGLKSGIPTRNARFNRLIDELEHVAATSTDPVLLTGPTGAGKSRLARRVYDLKRAARQLSGPFVEVNCATLRGDTAMSALFGHRRGAFTGAAADRPGLLRAADGGLLFLDEIGELGLDEQAMLLRALEERRFLPVGADEESSSDFRLIAGTNRDLRLRVAQGCFRDDLLARIDLWTFELPPLRERVEDIEPNVDFELERFASRTNRLVRFSAEARGAFLAFATSPGATWPGNFRDLAASVTRMATLAPGGRIGPEVVEAEIARLRRAWAVPATVGAGGAGGVMTARGAAVVAPALVGAPARDDAEGVLAALLGPDGLRALDRFDRAQLAEVVGVCRQSRSLSEAGRTLFAASRSRRTSVNDADRLRKYLARFGLSWDAVRATGA